jgi:anti-anti-sigma regulatory factor
VAPVTWSAYQHQDCDTVWLDLVGDLRGSVAEPLRATVVQTIEVHQPDRLLIGLDTASDIDTAGVMALMAGYLAAIGHGTSYHVTGARGRVRRVLQTAGILEVLADSDDLGALLLALMLRPSAPGPAADQ